jgi:DNA-binding NarL/FixJ family response regulator
MAGPVRRLKVLVADDHPIVRAGLQAVIESLAEFTLAGSVSSGSDAVLAAAADPPDIVVMDLCMAGLDGVEATRRLLSADPRIAVLVLTMYEDDEMVAAAVQAGARGYLVKGASHSDLARALRSVAAGDAVFGSGIADRALAQLSGRRAAAPPFPQLSEREREVLTHLAQGRGTQNIAATLRLSPKTIRNHVANLLAKLGVPDRAQAIAAARQAGLGAEPAARSEAGAQRRSGVASR